MVCQNAILTRIWLYKENIMRTGRNTKLVVRSEKLTTIPRDNGRRLIIDNYLSWLEAPIKSQREDNNVDIFNCLVDFLNNLEAKGYTEYKSFYRERMKALESIYGTNNDFNLDDAKYEIVNF